MVNFMCEGSQCNDNAGIYGAMVGLAIGAGLGALAGNTIKSHRWKSVPLDHVSVGVALRRGGGYSASLALRF
ncbi:MAG: hypothetical protein MUF51_07710 [Vicinamibacteria bacterium]|jgi:hypothetical protein|nr:hypothetical protein [Vicinamibacteria bacterium]